MGKVVSAAGDVTFTMRVIKADDKGLVIIGTMGVWDAEVFLTYRELFGNFVRPSTLISIVRIPFLLLKRLFL